jgi:outer membrane protein
VKKLILIATGFVCLAGGSYFLANTWGAPQAPAEEVPHRVGLIDIGYIFQNYEKLKHMAEEQKADEQAENAKLAAKYKKIQELAEELKSYNEGTPEFTARENKLTRMGSEFETERKMVGLELKKKGAKVFHQAYLEIQDAVEQLCDKYKFTVVIKFSRVDLGSTDPNKVTQLMNQPVLYHRKRDDLTDAVLKYLNGRYLQSAGEEAKPVTDSKPPKKDKKVTPAQAKE